MGDGKPDDYLSSAEVRPLIEGTERYRSLFTHNPHAVFSLDLEGNLTHVNPAAEQLTGYPAAELEGRHFLDVVTPPDLERMSARFVEVLSGEPRQAVATLTQKDGSQLDLHLLVVPVIVDGEVVGVHGVAEDVTTRNVALELLEARRAAEDANQAKSVFLANMSHELRTPLTTMLAAAELLEDSDLDPVQARFLQALLRNGDRLRSLIENILDITRIETRTVVLRPEHFELRPVLEEAIAWGRRQANAKSLPFDVHLDPGLELRCYADHERLIQVLTNLIDNAVKFTDAGRIGFSAELVAEQPGGRTLVVRVRDTGTGIPPALTDRVFDPFAQADPSLTRRHEGAGLGLAISRELVSLLGGTLELDSREGHGTEARVTVPLAPA